MSGWPVDAEHLVAAQRELAGTAVAAWVPPEAPLRVGGAWVCFPAGLTGPGAAGDPAWAAAVVMRGGRLVAEHVTSGTAGAAYQPGLLALRVGPILEQAVRGLDVRPDVLLVDASGRDHPRRAGLAYHLGAVLGMPTVGVTHRPLVGAGPWPGDHRGDTSPVLIDDAVVACWMRTRRGVRPLVVHPGWRTELTTALDVVGLTLAGRRTPEPLRRARQRARRARASGGAGRP